MHSILSPLGKWIKYALWNESSIFSLFWPPKYIIGDGFMYFSNARIKSTLNLSGSNVFWAEFLKSFLCFLFSYWSVLISISSVTFQTWLSFIRLRRLEIKGGGVFILPSCGCICLCIAEFMRFFTWSFNCLFFFFFNSRLHYKRD